MTEKPLIVYFGAGKLIPGTDLGPTLKNDVNYVLLDYWYKHSVGKKLKKKSLKYAQWIDGKKRESREILAKTVVTEYQKLSDDLKSKMIYMQADVKQTPIKSDSASEVHIYNLLGDPTENVFDNEAILNKAFILEEAIRITRPGGNILIGETSSAIHHPIGIILGYAKEKNLQTEIVFDKASILQDEFYESIVKFKSEELDFLVNNISKKYADKNSIRWKNIDFSSGAPYVIKLTKP